MDELLCPGDVVFTQAQPGSWLGDSIRWWTRTWNEPISKASHTGVIGNLAYPEDATIIEMTSPEGREVKLLERYGDQNIYVYRSDTEMGPEIANEMRQLIGRPYGYTKILLHLADAALGKLISATWVLPARLFGKKLRGLEFPFLSWMSLVDAVVCSQAVARAYWNLAGIHFGGTWPSRNPDNMLDWSESKEDLWFPVWQQEM